jgi:hypothetical protein
MYVCGCVVCTYVYVYIQSTEQGVGYRTITTNSGSKSICLKRDWVMRKQTGNHTGDMDASHWLQFQKCTWKHVKTPENIWSSFVSGPGKRHYKLELFVKCPVKQLNINLAKLSVLQSIRIATSWFFSLYKYRKEKQRCGTKDCDNFFKREAVTVQRSTKIFLFVFFLMNEVSR